MTASPDSRIVLAAPIFSRVIELFNFSAYVEYRHPAKGPRPETFATCHGGRFETQLGGLYVTCGFIENEAW